MRTAASSCPSLPGQGLSRAVTSFRGREGKRPVDPPGQSGFNGIQFSATVRSLPDEVSLARKGIRQRGGAHVVCRCLEYSWLQKRNEWKL